MFCNNLFNNAINYNNNNKETIIFVAYVGYT